MGVGRDVGVTDSLDIERVWRKEGERLWRAVAAFAGDAEVASDAVAEAFTQALDRASEIRDALPWIWRTSFRLATRELRRRRTQAPLTHRGAYEMRDPLVEVMGALQRLSPRQRAVVVLHDYADRPTDEIAEILGVEPGTVRMHLSSGRRRLREILGGDYV
jgi:DNA-directed RNA polymerase specialized sigma24 family protein